jgi:hypothetical protein
VTNDPTVFHLAIYRAITPWSQGYLTLRLDDYLAVVVQGRDTALGEEDDGLLRVPEVIVLLEVLNDFLVVHLAGHDVPFYHVVFVNDRVGVLAVGEG